MPVSAAFVVDNHSALAMLCALLVVEMYVLWKLGDQVSGLLFSLSQRSLPNKLGLYPVLAPGVALHETAHAAAALSCGVMVTRFVPFWPVQEKSGGWRFGYVRHKGCTSSQAAWIASAPLWGPPLLMYLLGAAVIPQARLEDGPLGVMSDALTHLSSPWAVLWVWLFVSSALSNFPSSVDLDNMRPAAPLVFAVLVGPLVLSALTLEPVFASGSVLLAIFLAPPALVCVLMAATATARGY